MESEEGKLLQASEQRLRLILEFTSEGWWEWNLVTGETYYSPEWYHMLGYEVNRFPSTIEWWRDLIHPDDQQRTFEQQQIYLRGKEPWEIEFRMRRAEGDYYWILSRGKVVDRNAEGIPLRAVGIHVNITEKKLRQQLEEENLVKAELLRGIIRTTFLFH